MSGATRLEANEEADSEGVIIKGAVFNFRGELLPVDFSATNPNAMNYFEGLGATNQEPVFTKIWGRQLSEVITKTITEESAFGEDSVKRLSLLVKTLLSLVRLRSLTHGMIALLSLQASLLRL